MAETVQQAVAGKQDVFTKTARGYIVDVPQPDRALLEERMEAPADRWILVLEDDEDDLSLTLRALRRVAEGLRVETAKDGEEAVRALEGPETPSLVLMDAHMPKLSGEEIIQRAKADPRFKDVPFIVFSSSIGPSEEAGFMAGGAAEVITKPLDYADYSEVLRKVVERIQ